MPVFKRDPARKGYSPDIDPFPNMFRLQTDPDGNQIRFLNYLQMSVQDIDWHDDPHSRRDLQLAADPVRKDEIRSSGTRRAQEQRTIAHAKAIVDGYASCPPVAQKKYRFLEQYHNAVVADLFGPRPDLIVKL